MESKPCCAPRCGKVGTILSGVFSLLMSSGLFIHYVHQAKEFSNYGPHNQFQGMSYRFLCVVAVLAAIMALCEFVVSIPMIYGSVRTQPRFVYPWVIFKAVFTSMLALLFCVLMWFLLFGSNKEHHDTDYMQRGVLVFYLLAMGIYLVIAVILLVVVYTYFVSTVKNRQIRIEDVEENDRLASI